MFFAAPGAESVTFSVALPVASNEAVSAEVGTALFQSEAVFQSAPVPFHVSVTCADTAKLENKENVITAERLRMYFVINVTSLRSERDFISSGLISNG